MKNFVLLTLFLLTACEEGGSGGQLVFGTSGSSSSASSASNTAYAYLEVYAKPMTSSSDSAYVRISTCEIPTGSVSGTDLDCSFSYDEGLLYNADLKFKWGTKDSVACPYIKFYPYYYRASNSASFTPEWSSSSIDCSDPENTDDSSCYGGVAPLLSTLSFPSSDYYFSDTSLTAEDNVEVSASASLGRTSNRMTANPPSTYNIGAGKSMADGSDGIVATFAGAYTGPLEVLRPYRVVCEDSFTDPVYTINFYLGDYDIAGPPASNNADDADFNDYPDWDSTLNTLDPQ